MFFEQGKDNMSLFTEECKITIDLKNKEKIRKIRIEKEKKDGNWGKGDVGVKENKRTEPEIVRKQGCENR